MYTLEGVSSVANLLLLMKSLNKTAICNVFFVSKGNLFDVYFNIICISTCWMASCVKQCKYFNPYLYLKEKIQEVPQSQTAALPKHQTEEEINKTHQAQIEQTYEKH